MEHQNMRHKTSRGQNITQDMEKAKHNTRHDTRMKIKYKKPKTGNKNKTNRSHDTS